jgi:hypothetical protein
MLRDLIVHEEIVISRVASQVWPYILAPNTWKMGPVLEHRHGFTGRCGELFAAVSPGSSQTLFYAQNVEVCPSKRRTIKLLRDDRNTLLGYASWCLRESEGTTTVTYDVYVQALESLEACEVMTDGTAAKELTDSGPSRFLQELQNLKRLVEHGQTLRASKTDDSSILSVGNSTDA